MLEKQQLTKYGAICFKRRSLLMQLFSMIFLAAPKRRASKAAVAFGVTLCVLGFALRFWSTGHAGIATRTQTDNPPKRLITNGPFRYSRNPIYAGNQLMFAGSLLSIGQGLKTLLFSVPAFLFYSLITRYEEDLLARAFGTAYEEYKEKTPRWLPCQDSLFQSHGSQDSGETSRKEKSGVAEFSWLQALQTERYTAYNCTNLFLLRWASRAAQQRFQK